MIPQTISISYGSYEPSIQQDYSKSLCLLFGMLGVLGASVIAGSGDVGVGAGNCRDSLGHVRFYTSFPASCMCGVQFLLHTGTGTSRSPYRRKFAGPWVTSVGGTMGNPPEIAASISGGGFSAFFPRPNYQDFAVITFLQQLGTTYVGNYKCVRSRGLTQRILTMYLHSPEGRGVPDIAVQSSRYSVIFESQFHELSSTSCSTNVRLPSSLRSALAILEHLVELRHTDRGGHRLAA
jgi:tripeptidyl-peptidase-1